jgi:predicted PurR-regulated permease PerM
LVSKQDIYYVIAIGFILGFFGIWIIPQTAHYLILHAVSELIIILVVCIILPLVAVALLWLIIQEIQDHFKELDLSDEDTPIEEGILARETFSEKDLEFIEEQVRTQLEEHQFEDEDVFELSKDLVLSYVNNRIKTNTIIPLIDISKDLELPIEVIKDLLLLLIADNLVDAMLEKDALVRSE